MFWKESAGQRRCYTAESQCVQRFKNQIPRLFWCLEMAFIDVNLFSQNPTRYFENKEGLTTPCVSWFNIDDLPSFFAASPPAAHNRHREHSHLCSITVKIRFDELLHFFPQNFKYILIRQTQIITDVLLTLWIA